MKFEFEPTTFIFQFILIVALILILKTLYFDPILKLLKRRESLTSGKKEDAQHLHDKIEELRVDYDMKISEIRQELDKERSGVVSKAKAEAQSLIQKAKDEMKANMAAEEKKLKSEIEKVKKQIPELSTKIAKEVSDAMSSSKVVQL